MDSLLKPLDIFIFFGSILVVMAVGLWVGRKEETSDDYYLAGKTTRWWGVAGSIFGSNISANHIVGMMGIGFTVGFAQSNFEISAIAGLLVLCYALLPVYRKLNLYTLSEYLGRRYDDSSRLAYAIIMIVVIVVIQMVPGFYIGSRAINQLLEEDKTAVAEAEVDKDGTLKIDFKYGGVGYEVVPEIIFRKKVDGKELTQPLKSTTAVASIADGIVTGIEVKAIGDELSAGDELTVEIRGGREDSELNPGDVDPTLYCWGIVLMAIITGSYTIIGGLKAVIFTDVIQSALLLVAGLVIAFFTFSQPEIGGWSGMMSLDLARENKDQLVHLYQPSDHADLPWTGVLSGLMVLHFYYWGTNQFIVQRALSAKSLTEARFGIIFAGLIKLLIPFISIGTGIAAYYLFQARGVKVAQDVVFTELLTRLVAPVGYGLVGLVAAGIIGAILSSLDSMMNSAATIITFDVYKKYVDPEASEKKLIWIGRVCIFVFIVGSAAMAIFQLDPNSKDSFFLNIASQQSKLVAGVVVAFAVGMIWKRATAAGSLAAIISGAALSYGLPYIYQSVFTGNPAVVELFGKELNFMHSVFLAAVIATLIHIGVSLMTQPNHEKSQLTWIGLKIFSAATLRRTGWLLAGMSVWCLALAVLMVNETISPTCAAWLGGIAAWLAFIISEVCSQKEQSTEVTAGSIIRDDRFLGGLLAGVAVFMMYYFY